MLEELKRLAHLLATQDNACTSDPIFTVQRRERRIGADLNFFSDGEVYVHHDSDREPVFDDQHPEEFKRFEDGVYPEDDSQWDWEQLGYVDDWIFDQPFLTREAAEQYRVNQAHNLGTSRLYVESAHNNPEWRLIRRLLGGEIESIVDKLEARVNGLESGAAERDPDDCDCCGNPMDRHICATSDVCLDCWIAAKSRAQEFERAFRNLVARIDCDGGHAQEGGTVAGSLERAETKVVTLQARVRELEARDIREGEPCVGEQPSTKAQPDLHARRDAWLKVDAHEVEGLGWVKDERHNHSSDGKHIVTLTRLGEKYVGEGSSYDAALALALAKATGG